MHEVKSIQDLLNQISRDEILLPEFQRGYVWNRDQVRGLMQSLYRKHPTGHLLIWRIYKPSYLQQVPDFKDAPYDLGSFDEIAHYRGGRGGRAVAVEAGFDTARSGGRDRRRGRRPNGRSCSFDVTFERRGTAPVPVRWLFKWGRVAIEEVVRRRLFDDIGQDRFRKKSRLSTTIDADIAGVQAHARALDADSKGASSDIHRRVGTTMLFESSGGQVERVAHLPELRFALGEPSIDTTSVDTTANHLAWTLLTARRTSRRRAAPPRSTSVSIRAGVPPSP